MEKINRMILKIDRFLLSFDLGFPSAMFPPFSQKTERESCSKVLYDGSLSLRRCTREVHCDSLLLDDNNVPTKLTFGNAYRPIGAG